MVVLGGWWLKCCLGCYVSPGGLIDNLDRKVSGLCQRSHLPGRRSRSLDSVMIGLFRVILYTLSIPCPVNPAPGSGKGKAGLGAF